MKFFFLFCTLLTESLFQRCKKKIHYESIKFGIKHSFLKTKELASGSLEVESGAESRVRVRASWTGAAAESRERKLTR